MANYEITTKAGATYQLDLPDAMSETEIMDYFNNRYLPSLEQDTVNRPLLSEPSGDLTQFNAPVEQPSQATIAQMQAEANPKDTSDFSRGFKTSYEQLPELGYGLEAGAYAIGESAFGEGGMLTQGKQEAVAKMIEAQKETQANAKQSDSFTFAYEKAKQGDFNALADTVQYGLGYGLGQMSQAVITGGLGSTVAKTAAETFAKEYTAKLVEQEALKVAEQTAARELTQEQIQQQAVKNVAESIANKGRDYALGAQAVGLEGGEILGDLAKQSTEQNRSLTAGEVTKGLGATALAAAGEFYADRFGLDILGGKRLSEAGKYTEGLKGNLLRGAATGVKGGAVEGGTEFAQTLIEEAGKGKDPFSSESLRQAIDATALGFIGGGAIGTVGGALSPAQQRPDQPATGEIDPSMLSGGLPNSTAQTTAQQPAQTSSKWQETMGKIRGIVGENQLVNNETIAKDVMSAETIEDAIAVASHATDAIAFDYDMNMEQAATLAQDLTKTDTDYLDNKDYQDAVQLENQLSTVRDQLAYNKFQTAFEESNQQASRAEFNALVEQEISNKNQQLKDLIQYQSDERARKAEVEVSIPSINKALEDAQWAKTRNNRNVVIQMVFDRNVPAENIFPAIKAELKRQGFKDTEINQDDIDAYRLLKASPTTPITPVAQAPEMIPPTENEMNVEGLIKEKVEPVISEQVSPALRKVDEWVNNGATYKNGILIDSKGKKFLLNKAQREYYSTNKSLLSVAQSPVTLIEQGYSETQQGQDTITGAPSFNTRALKEVLDIQIKERVDSNRENRNLSSVNQRIEEQQWIKTRNNRNAAIQTVFDENVSASNIESAIKAELKRQGFKDTELSEDDINAYELLQSAYARRKPEIANAPVDIGVQQPVSLKRVRLVRQGVNAGEQVTEGQQGQDVVTNFVEPSTPVRQDSDALRKVDEWLRAGATYKNGMLIDSKGKKFLLNKVQREYYLENRATPIAKVPVDMGEVGNAPRKRYMGVKQQGVNAGEQITGSIGQDQISGVEEEQPTVQPVVKKKPATNNLRAITGLEPIETAIGKLGGINREMANKEGFSDFKGWYFTKKSKQSFDGMAEILRGYGFDVSGGNDLVAKLRESLDADFGTGKKVYTFQGLEHQMALDQAEEFKAFEAEQKELAKELLKVASGNPTTIEEIQAAETPEDFDQLLTNIVTLSEDEADDFWNSIGEENADQTTKDASIATIKENAPEILSTYTQQEVTQREEAQKAAEKEQAVKDAKAEEKRQGDYLFDSTADEMLGTGMTTNQDIFAPKRKPKFSKAKAQERLAPNGRPSNLNVTQYEQVRTPEFKAWFGDWENDPENASKVVDENGEPLVVYHGTDAKFWEFNEYKGNFFTQDPNYAKVYSNGKKPMALFLNIRNPFDSQNKKDNDFYNTKFIPYFSNKYPRLSEGLTRLKSSEPLSFIWADKLYSALRHFERVEGVSYDGMMVDEGDTPKIAKSNALFAFVPLHNNQIKSATGNTGEFSKESNDIRFSKAKVSKSDDVKYLAAVEAGDMETAQEMVNIAAENAGYGMSDYQMSHEAPNRNDYPINDLTTIYPEDIYSSSAVNYYGDGQPSDSEAIAKLQRMRGKKPNSAIMVYRAVPNDVKESMPRNGDWVSTTRAYAEEHGKRWLPNGYRVMEIVTTVGNIFTDGNSIHELGFDDGKEYGYANTKNNRKLIDAVTYDDDANVIPLSKRFNKRSDDVRFSQTQEPTANNHTEQSLKEGLTQAGDDAYGKGWTDRLLATGMFKIISALEANKIVGRGTMFHKAWHGSPHDYNKFDSSYMGTGEGAQAFGWGHYFTDAKRIAEWYKDTLSNKQISLLVDGVNATTLSTDYYGSEAKAVRILLDNLKYPNMATKEGLSEEQIKTIIDKTIDENMPRSGENDPNWSKNLESIRNYLSELKGKKLEIGKGKLYEVELAPTQEEYLDWNKPMSQQSDKVLELLKQWAEDSYPNYLAELEWKEQNFPNTTKGLEKLKSQTPVEWMEDLFNEPDYSGEDFYKELAEQVGYDEDASRYLNSMGIRGIRFKAEGGKSEDNNYVIFDDRDINIEAKYSMAGDIEAFFNPADGKTYFVAENIDKATDLHYLMMHEVGVHALNMGGNKEEFESILKQVDNLIKVKNPAALKGRQDALDADTPQGDFREETLAYLLKYAPKLKIVERFKAWLKNALRNMAKMFPASQKLGFIQWANKLSDQDLLYIANATLRKAPEMLGSSKREANSFIAKASKALSAEQMRALGQLDLLEFVKEVANTPRENSRIGMPHGEILKRVPELTESAKNMMDMLYDNGMLVRGTKGNLVKGVSNKDVKNYALSNPEFRKLAEVHDALVEKYKPVEPYQSLPTPATEAEMRDVLKDKQVVKINQFIPDGYKVKLRLDIPAYKNEGVWVVTAHEGNTQKNSIFDVKEATPIAYYGHAVGNNPKFSIDEVDALKIADKTRDKYPLATVDAEYVNMSAEEAKRLADEALDNPNWIQVGMDPERHSYFYDRKTMQPVLSGSRVIQIGSILMVENPVFGNKKSFLFSKKAKEGEIVNRSTGYTAYDKAKPIPEEVDNKANYPEGVSLEEERDWLMQQLRRFDSFRKLNDKSNELINKYLTTMGRLPELGNYLGLRYQTLGKIDNVDDIVRNVFDTLQKATKEDSKEIYTYLTDNKATTEFIIDPQMALMAKDLKEAITIIGKKLVEFNIIPMESFQMYEGRYLPRVYLEHIIQSSDRYQSLGSGKTLSPMGYAKRRDNNLPEEFRRLIKGEIKNTAYLASRTLSIPLRDIAMMEFFNQISDNEKWVWKQSLINIELDAKTNRPTAIFDDDGVINYKATNSALEGTPKKIIVRKVTPYFLDKEADRILDQSYSAPEEDRKDMQDLAKMMKRAASQAMVNMDAVPADFMKMPNIAKYGSLRGLVVHKLIYDDLVGTINTYGAAGEQSALENFFGNNGILAKITNAFKFSHVAINIPTQVTNLLSNGLLLHMSGVRFDKVPVRVTQAFKEVLNDGENYKKMIAMGGRKATFSNQELSGITEWLLENEAEFSDKNTDWFSIVHIMRELSYLTGKTVRGANNLHQNIEMVFKVAKFIDMKAKGANDETAAVMAHQALFDYSFIPRWAKWLRTVPMGIPFITWTIKSFEATLRTAANRPTTFLPYYMLGYAMSLAAAADFGDDGEDKLKAILKLLPERMQRGGSIWILPIRDDAGRTQLIDMKNLFPWGKTAEAIDSLSKLVGNQDVAELRNLADSVGVFSSPITQAVVAIDTNKDAFTGKQIVDENDPPAAKLQSILEYTYGMMSPPMLGGKGDIATLIKSQFPSEYEGIMNKDGSPKKTEQQAFIHLFTGLSIKSVDSEFDRHKKIEAFNSMITGIKAQRTRELRSNPNLSEESRRIVREKYDARIERVKEKKQKFKDETDVLK